jgi:hypothetical protein
MSVLAVMTVTVMELFLVVLPVKTKHSPHLSLTVSMILFQINAPFQNLVTLTLQRNFQVFVAALMVGLRLFELAILDPLIFIYDVLLNGVVSALDAAALHKLRSVVNSTLILRVERTSAVPFLFFYLLAKLVEFSVKRMRFAKVFPQYLLPVFKLFECLLEVAKSLQGCCLG